MNLSAGRGDDYVISYNNDNGNAWNPEDYSNYNLGPGDDSIYFAGSTGTAYVTGASGKDLIETNTDLGGRLYVWGDYEYDEENDDDDIWGDDDIININRQRNTVSQYDPRNLVYVWGGDGEDQILVEGNHNQQWLHGDNGDDHITYGGRSTGVYVFGDDGDDLIDSYKNSDGVDGVWYQNIKGGEGNDVITSTYASHSYIFGDDGNDNITT